MNEQEIISNITSRMGIVALNDMQLTMADNSAALTVLVAPTGAGKTLAFTIPLLKSLAAPRGQVQAVVIAPSRELVLQIYDVIRPLATGYKTVALYGGHSMADEVNSLIMSPDIIVATPGRLVDHIRRGQLRPGIHLAMLVLDEYDKALELGFADDMRRIARFFVAPDRIILTSATIMEELPAYFTKGKPRLIDFSSRAAEAPRARIHIERVESPERDKLETLADILLARHREGSRAIVFVNHRESAERVYRYLRSRRFPAGLYHGGLEQFDREKALELLNNGTTPILVSTDLASRGLDIDSVDSVIHYHLPLSPQAWTHRNGRTARQDATGNVFVITADGESIPEWVEWDNDYNPPHTDPDARPRQSATASLYFNAGKKEKISRGDIVGFLIAVGGLEAAEIGRIAVKDHWAMVAVPAKSVDSVLEATAHQKIKARKVKVTRLK